MAQIANNEPLAGQEVPTSEIAAFAETAPSVAAVVGWLAARLDLYVYLAKPDGRPILHAGREREGEVRLAPIPGEELSLAAVGIDDLDVLSQVALILGGALAREKAAQMEEAKSHGDLLRSLISGDSGSLEGAQRLGWDLSREVFLIIGRCDGAHIVEMAEEWRRIIRQRDPKAVVVYFPHEVVAIVAKDSLVPLSFAQTLPRYEGIVGLSSPGIASDSIGQLYGQADVAITVSQSLGKVDAVADLDSLGTYRLLALIEDSQSLRLFLNDTLKELATRTDLDAVDLRRTLATLIDRNLNIAEAARDLHFHYNTLRYRISKLEKMLGNFTEDSELRLSIALALRIMSLRGL